MKKRENNLLREAALALKDIWLRRDGLTIMGKEIYRDNTIHAMVQDTIDALWKEGNRPLIKAIAVSEDKLKWTFVIHIPPGMTYNEFKVRQEHFQDATHGTAHIEKRGKRVTLEIMTMELQKRYPFEKWDGSQYPKMYIPIPIGYSARGLIVEDLIEFPHVFIAGETKYGKTNMIHVIANSIVHFRPEVQLVVIDLKRTEFPYLQEHALIIDQLPDAQKVLLAVNNELDNRLELFKNHRVNKIQKYLKRVGPLPLIVVVIDELAEMNCELCQSLLERLGRLGRAQGIHLIAATQRPSSSLYKKFGDIKALFPARFAFLTADRVNSQMILDNDAAAHLPAIPGRAIYKWGIDQYEVQSLYLDPDDAERLLKEREAQPIINGGGFKNVYRESGKRLPPRQSNNDRPSQVPRLEHRTNSAITLPWHKER